MKNKKACLPAGKGFTLLELLIVIAVLAVLGAIVIFLLNPTETLKKARDSQRISDLSTIKTALGIYLTSVSSPKLDGGDNSLCATKVWYSIASSTATITDTVVAGSKTPKQVATETTNGNIDGNGWIPAALSTLIGGSPISSFPIDPTNSVTVAAVTSTDLVYRYSCKSSPLGFEINAQLESNAFTVEDNKRAKDGGNNTNLYEVGSDLTILPGSSDF